MPPTAALDRSSPQALDLDVCAREPIRTPGAIQPHGALLVLDAATLRVLAAELLENNPPEFATVHGYNAAETRAFLQNLAKAGAAPWATVPGPATP